MVAQLGCEEAQEAISARLDGELASYEHAALDDHLTFCGDCQAYERDLVLLHRTLRVRPAEPVPDLTNVIAARTAPLLPTPAEPDWRRYALAAIAVTQLTMGLLALVNDVATSGHVGRELGAFEVAMAVGLLGVVARPAHARSILAVAGAYALLTVASSIADVRSGNTDAIGEGTHVLALGAVALLWLLAQARPAPHGRRMTQGTR